MSAAASKRGTVHRGLILNDFAAYIQMNLSDDLCYVGFKGISRLRFIAIDLRLQKTTQEQV